VKNLRIGLSMRTTEALNYEEKRDSVARNWADYLIEFWPHIQWIFIPNIGHNVRDYLAEWNVNAIILTGGEDIGSDVLRDETEVLMYHYALENDFPLFGVCRGFQLICKLNHLEIKSNKEVSAKHIATNHSVNFMNESFVVNSFHSNYIDDIVQARVLFDEIGIAEDNTLEAVYRKNLMGFMWHPERRNIDQRKIDVILKNFFYVS
jgi:putative glutamine amidotransferase